MTMELKNPKTKRVRRGNLMCGQGIMWVLVPEQEWGWQNPWPGEAQLALRKNRR